MFKAFCPKTSSRFWEHILELQKLYLVLQLVYNVLARFASFLPESDDDDDNNYDDDDDDNDYSPEDDDDDDDETSFKD